MAQAAPFRAQPSVPIFVCNLDASTAREVCEAHDYLEDKKRDLVCAGRNLGFYPNDHRVLAKINSALKVVDSVILGELSPNSAFRSIPPVLWAIYSTH